MIASVNYRLYRPDDFAALYALERACFQPPLRFTRRYLEQLVQSPSSATWLAEDGQFAGFCIVDWQREGGETIAYLQTLEVAPEFRRKGIALELLRRGETSAKAAGAALIWLHVDAKNHAALQLYRALGYEQRGSQKHYYGRDRDADVYWKAFLQF